MQEDMNNSVVNIVTLTMSDMKVVIMQGKVV
jgi:hypothetical protein